MTGTDASPAQVAAARAAGLDVVLSRAESLPFEGAFDAVFSNAALHWMTAPDAVIAAIHRALRPGGRFVAEMGGAGNIAHVLDAILAAFDARGIDARPAVPWYFPSPGEYGAKLAAAGFEIRRMVHVPRPNDLDCSMTDWLEIFARDFEGLLAPAARGPFREDVARRLEPVLFDRARGVWWVDHVRLRFEAVRLA